MTWLTFEQYKNNKKKRKQWENVVNTISRKLHELDCFTVGVLLEELFPFFDLGIWRQVVDTLCAQLLIQFNTDQFETLQALL